MPTSSFPNIRHKHQFIYPPPLSAGIISVPSAYLKSRIFIIGRFASLASVLN